MKKGKRRKIKDRRGREKLKRGGKKRKARIGFIALRTIIVPPRREIMIPKFPVIADFLRKLILLVVRGRD